MKQCALGAGSLAHGGEDGVEIRIGEDEVVLEKGQPTSRIFSSMLPKPDALPLSGPAPLTVPNRHSRRREHLRVVAYAIGARPACFQLADERSRPPTSSRSSRAWRCARSRASSPLPSGL